MTKQHAAAPSTSRAGASANQDESRPVRHTVRERLVRDMNVDVEVSATRRDVAPVYTTAAAREDNQQGLDDYADMSLELLALLSPHGTTQQWEQDEENDTQDETKEDHIDHAKRLSMLARVDLSEYSGAKMNQYREAPDLTSPTQHMVPFQVSPSHSAHGNELDLVSPVALPESPQSQATWDKDELANSYDQQHANTTGFLESSKQDAAVNTSCVSPDSFTMTRRAVHATGISPNRPQSRIPGKTHVAIETKPKARHGGIYSLLLKNKAPEHEPVLVDEKRSPLGPEGAAHAWPLSIDEWTASSVSPRAHSTTKRTSPPSIAKLQHGGIYGMLRRNSKSSSG